MRVLLDAALRYPKAFEDHPWEHTVVKVGAAKKAKIFAFVDRDEHQRLTVTVKLPTSSGVALTLPWCEPTGYGLGKAGWVSATFEHDSDVPLPLLLAWLDESYRAVAPASLAKTVPPRSR